MTIDNPLQTRKIYRLQDFDYSQNGVYHITICSYNKSHIFSEVVFCDKNNSKEVKTRLNVGVGIDRPSIILSSIGNIINVGIQEIPQRYADIKVDKYVIMPNHIHLLIAIDGNDVFNKCGRSMPAPTVSDIICQFKSITCRQAAQPIWQKSFYDHIVRNDRDYEKIWDYIDANPDKWVDDEYYTAKS